jgi:hypothetical protein
MVCSMKRISGAVVVTLLFLLSAPVPSWAVNGERIGSITAIEGEVWLAHRGDQASYPAMLGDSIYLYDHVQTEKESRVQILFEDESLLNLAENTYIQITEHVYSPEENRRSSFFRLVMGKVRAIVGRYFGGGSTYKVSTPTAIIGVRGTHFIIDASLSDETAVVCVDTDRDLVVRNVKDEVPGEVVLKGGLMTKVLDGQPPTAPTPAPDDLMMRLLMDTRVMLPSLGSGTGALRESLGKEAALTAREVTEEGRIPPIPPAPEQPLLRFPPEKLPEPPPPPPTPQSGN